LAKSPSQELAENSWPVKTTVYIQREEVGERGEEGEEGKFFFFFFGVSLRLVCWAYCFVKVRPLQPFVEIPCS
jgi:hypothetical protein